MKKNLYPVVMCCSLLCLYIAGCTFANQNPELATTEAGTTPSITMTLVPVTESSPSTLTPSPTVQIVLPAVTLSPQEAENALKELLKTNGN